MKLYMLPVAVARSSSDDNAIRDLGLLPVLWMTSCLPIIGEKGDANMPILKVTHQGAAPGSEVMTSTNTVPISAWRGGKPLLEVAPITLAQIILQTTKNTSRSAVHP